MCTDQESNQRRSALQDDEQPSYSGQSWDIFYSTKSLALGYSWMPVRTIKCNPFSLKKRSWTVKRFHNCRYRQQYIYKCWINTVSIHEGYLNHSYFTLLFLKHLFFYFLIYLLIMLLQLSHFRPFTQLHPAHPLPHTFPLYSSCPWVIHISSLASTFPTLFLPSPCLFSTYHLCYLFSVPFPPLFLSHPPW